ncbi:MAG: ABC-F family ATP-binding cassette domain-containing protein [Anaeroplasmataceae bacterium]
MSVLKVTNVTHGFGERVILDKATFTLNKGEHIGLIGANGEGKSTFLNIITGALSPDEGKVEWARRITTGYLDQHVKLEKGITIRSFLQTAFKHMYELEKEMLSYYDKMGDCTEDEMNYYLTETGDIQAELESSGFYILDSKIEEVGNGLGLKEIGFDKDVSELSGGQRSKVLLTKLLLENPMILILDEPTNFLDETHIRWLKNYLINYENAFILVSHDIPFLNDVVNVIYHLERGVFTRYSGNYDLFTSLYEVKQKHHEIAYEKQQKEIEKLETFIAKNKARVATTNMAKSRQKQLDKMVIIEKSSTKAKPTFKFREARTSGKFVIVTNKLVIGYDEPLTKPIDFVLERGKKVVLKGSNGIGKSTLLKTLLGKIKPISGSVELDYNLEAGYFVQEEKYDKTTAHEEIWNMYPFMSNAEVRGALASCGLTKQHIESLMLVLSGGEAAKVRICKLMLTEYNLLCLDEPTNHLDKDAKESLREAISNFKGTVLLVCHEPEFYQGIVDDIVNVEEWSLKLT